MEKIRESNWTKANKKDLSQSERSQLMAEARNNLLIKPETLEKTPNYEDSKEDEETDYKTAA